MQIKKILNNNVVVILDENGKEQIALGRGLAYMKKVGDTISNEEIGQIFVLKGAELNAQLKELLSEIPIEYIELTNEIMNYANTKLEREIKDTILIALVDHIYTSVKRYLDGITVTNGVLWDIKRFYETEYQIGLAALDIIEKKLKIRLPDDEAGFIAIHIVNASMSESSIQEVNKITKVIREITNIVKYYFKIDFNEHSVYYYRFVSHIRFFAKRVFSHSEQHDEVSLDLLETIKKSYVNAFDCVEKIASFMKQKYDYTIVEEEKLYLTIHIARVVEKNNNPNCN